MYRVFYKTELFIGSGSLEQLKTYQNQNIFIVADPFLIQTGQLEELIETYLDSSNEIQIFSEIVPDPPIEVVVQGIQAAQGKDLQTMIAIGGGSAIDAAKAIYYFAKEQGLFEDLCFVAIPTTSGTGSEVTDFSVITDTELGQKYPIVSRDLLPDVAILDADLVKSLPSSITADTGMDVLTHAFEAYVSTQASDFSDALAEKAVQLVFEYLPKAYRNGQDVEAREKLHIASTLAGMAFNTASLGINHSLAHAAGARFHIPHGRLNSILMPAVIRYNAGYQHGKIQPDCLATAKRYQRLAKLLGYCASNPGQGVRQLIEAVTRLQGQLKLPKSLSQYGVLSNLFQEYREALAKAALVDKCSLTNPRQPDATDLLAILDDCF